MPPCLTYIAEYLVDDPAFSNPAWVIFCTEHVALLAVAWLREAYAAKRLWWLPDWVIAQLRVLGDALTRVLGNRRNVDDLFA